MGGGGLSYMLAASISCGDDVPPLRRCEGIGQCADSVGATVHHSAMSVSSETRGFDNMQWCTVRRRGGTLDAGEAAVSMEMFFIMAFCQSISQMHAAQVNLLTRRAINLRYPGTINVGIQILQLAMPKFVGRQSELDGLAPMSGEKIQRGRFLPDDHKQGAK